MSSYKKYYDPAQVESDQKDLIISQLKAELFELRQNEKDYDELRSKLNNLEHRYNLLQEEKILNEREFKARHETNVKTIGNLKIDIDTLRQELNAVNREIDDLRVENQNVNDVINAKSGEIARHKAEIADVYDHNNKLSLEKKELDGLNQRLRADNRDHNRENDDTNHRIVELTERRNKYERLIRELDIEKEKLERANDGYQKQIDNLRYDIRNKNEAIKYAEGLLADNRKHIIAQEADASDLKRVNEKTRGDALSTQKSQQYEFSKNLEVTTHINKLETLIGEREDDINRQRRDYDELKRDHLKLIDTNSDLNHDIEASTRHLDLLTVQNNDLVNEIEKFNEQDERVRNILDRKDRVYEVKNRTEGKMKQSAHVLNSSIRSPGKRRGGDE